MKKIVLFSFVLFLGFLYLRFFSYVAWEIHPRNLDKDFEINLSSQVKIKMLFVNGGKFLAGEPILFRLKNKYGILYESISPPLNVKIKDFYLSETEVTVSQFHLVAGSSSIQVNNFPVANLEISEMESFCASLSKVVGKIVRLPTEFEWEYAARCGSSNLFDFGNDYSKVDQYGWFTHNSYHEVGTKKHNFWGFHDLLGNVSEITLLCYPEKIKEFDHEEYKYCMRGYRFIEIAEPCNRWPYITGRGDTKSPNVGFRIAIDS